MKLLILTQKVNKNDPVLGFFHRWIEEFAKHFEKVTVICLEKGEYSLPDNVSVYSLGKEEGKGRLAYVARFYSLIWKLRKEYDAVFVHMNPVYIVLGSLWWKMWKKTIGLWYTHKHVDLKLRIAVSFCDFVMTASKESFRLPTRKLRIMGHGIDTSLYKVKPLISRKFVQILQVGRITPIKQCETAIETLVLLRKTDDYRLRFIGNPYVAEDEQYKKKLQALVAKYHLKDSVVFAGNIHPSQMPLEYQNADLTLNLSPTGGMDKVGLESLACERPVFTSNQAFSAITHPFEERFLCRFNDPDDIVSKILSFQNKSDSQEILHKLSQKVRNGYDIRVLANRILAIYGKTS